MIRISDDKKKLFSAEKCVSEFMRIGHDVVRLFKNRSTRRFERGGEYFYIKSHSASGWWPILEDLLRFRIPQVGARPEWLAIQAADEQGIRVPEIVAFGEEGGTWASQQSFLITKEIAPAISLEELFQQSAEVSPVLKRRLIRAVAKIARKLHTNGLNHRDFYIRHFLFEQSANESDEPKLHLIDLHRAQKRKKTPLRWVVKDIGGLYFSAMDIDLSVRDLLLFVRYYTGRPIRESLNQDKKFWRAVEQRATRLYRKVHKRQPGISAPKVMTTANSIEKTAA